jgi:hypothetical protein
MLYVSGGRLQRCKAPATMPRATCGRLAAFSTHSAPYSSPLTARYGDQPYPPPLAPSSSELYPTPFPRRRVGRACLACSIRSARTRHPRYQSVIRPSSGSPCPRFCGGDSGGLSRSTLFPPSCTGRCKPASGTAIPASGPALARCSDSRWFSTTSARCSWHWINGEGPQWPGIARAQPVHHHT